VRLHAIPGNGLLLFTRNFEHPPIVFGFRIPEKTNSDNKKTNLEERGKLRPHDAPFAATRPGAAEIPGGCGGSLN